MILGAIRFRTFGAFVGFFLGIFIEELIEGKSSLFGSMNDDREDQEHQLSAYQEKLIILIAALLKTNRTITQEQSHYILKYFYRQFGTPKGKFLYAKLKKTVAQDTAYISISKSLFGTTREGKYQMINFLYGLTKVNRPMHAEEKKVLEQIAMNIGMTQYDFEQIISDQSSQRKSTSYIHKGITSSSYYQTLGVSEKATILELKKAYRTLVLKFHPDKTLLSKELAALKFQEVQEAYDAIRALKGIK
jgi:DnaJ like chaperone protein